MYQNGKNISFTDRTNGSVDMFLHDIRRSEPLSTNQEHELWRLMRQGDGCARNRLIFSNLRYVVAIAKKYLASGAAFEDLLMSGALGITKAADMFDGSLGYRFISFATWYIVCEVRKTAYGHISYKQAAESLDEPIGDREESDTMLNRLRSSAEAAPDWYVRYDETLDNLKKTLDSQYWKGVGDMLEDYLRMMESGYSSSDFARKHALSDHQMKRFFEMLHNGSRQVLKAA